MGRITRKNKSSWRKDVDITDVETFLEGERQNERIGNVALKPDTELFAVDRADTERASLKTSRKAKFQQNPKFCWSLENTSKVSDPIVKRNVKVKKSSAPSGRKVKTTALVRPKAVRSKTNLFNVDIWENENTTTKTAPAHKKQSTVPNVEVPAAGSSYNPAIDDYNELKQAVVSRELKYIKHVKHLERTVTAKFTKLSKEDREEMIHKEMSEGLFDNNEEAESDNSDNEKEYSAINPPVRNKKKDRKTRTRKIVAVRKRAAELQVKHEIKKLKDIASIPKLNSEINKMQSKTKQKQTNRVARAEEKSKLPRRVAYMKFEEAEEDFAEPTELADGLRTILPNKSLLVDRFKSFQKRALIAPKKHRDGIRRTNKSTLKKWKRFTLASHKAT
ncbi:ribosome biogenesis protein NOP53 [Malaya genurostris]|uniref:ribosome biogenesis protein NOP53 n=1 Tax=Malaya genurostris TaxID=325434 RepID=UPI0026F40953|nr:ribosome biogenesis protein NOP53 [Malaya genurostris]